MADENEGQEHWLAVIGKSLAYLCLKQAEKTDSAKMTGVLDKVKFLRGLGLSQAAAAEAAGSSPASVAELIRVAGKRKKESNKGGRRNASKKKRS